MNYLLNKWVKIFKKLKLNKCDDFSKNRKCGNSE